MVYVLPLYLNTPPLTIFLNLALLENTLSASSTVLVLIKAVFKSLKVALKVSIFCGVTDVDHIPFLAFLASFCIAIKEFNQASPPPC